MLKHASSSSFTRRQFIHRTALAAAGAATLTGCTTAHRQTASTDKLRIACVGVGGKGRSDLEFCSGEVIVAVCDTDYRNAAPVLKAFPKAKFYFDWREMLEKEEKNIDAVTVSTPDHMHGLVASAAIKLNKHVDRQKPLTQTVYEARYLRKLAGEYKVVTQMGNQGSAEDGLRRAVEVVQAGVIGPVRQIHVWTDRPLWPQGVLRPPGEDRVPDSFKWDLWLGPAPFRPYRAEWPKPQAVMHHMGRTAIYQPFCWRAWLDFGCGALGDMACHTANLPFRAARLGYPKVVELLDHSELNSDTYPEDVPRSDFCFPLVKACRKLSFSGTTAIRRTNPARRSGRRRKLPKASRKWAMKCR